jgi:hypothetical protein
MRTLEEIEAAILGLSEQDRLHLADKVLGNLPKPPGAMGSEDILAEEKTGAIRVTVLKHEKRDPRFAMGRR